MDAAATLTAADLAVPLDFSGDLPGGMVWQYFVSHPRVLPMLRGHSARVLSMAGQIMTVDIGELVLLVRADPTSVAELLRAANGPLLFRGSPVTALDEAIIRLGRREVYNVLATVAARSLFRPQAQNLLRLMPKPFWQVQRDAVATALSAAWLAHSLRVSDYEDAFMLGLFAQVGRLGALFALGNLALADAMALPEDPLAFVDARPQMLTRMGQDMLRGWGLDELLVARCRTLGQGGPWPVRAERLLHVVRLVGAQLALLDAPELAPALEQALQASREGLGLAETQLPTLERHLAATKDKVLELIGSPA